LLVVAGPKKNFEDARGAVLEDVSLWRATLRSIRSKANKTKL